jgi:hypothetical protein
MAAPDQHLSKALDLLSSNGATEAFTVGAASLTHLQQHNDDWRPLLHALKALDAGWDWLSDFEANELPSADWETYAVIGSSGRAEGLMSIHLQKDSVYIDRLAIAPWNRIQPKGAPREWRGVGAALFLLAVERSMSEPWDGRVTLHSLEDPMTLAFYRKMRMNEGEAQNVDGMMLPFFELNPQQAHELMEDRKEGSK